MLLLSDSAVIKPRQADDFFSNGSIILVHFNAVEFGTQW